MSHHGREGQEDRDYEPVSYTPRQIEALKRVAEELEQERKAYREKHAYERQLLRDKLEQINARLSEIERGEWAIR